jgi:ssDNA-binding Zn-finger/Zn-ribbon topoisomerase 1
MSFKKKCQFCGYEEPHTDKGIPEKAQRCPKCGGFMRIMGGESNQARSAG